MVDGKINCQLLRQLIEAENPRIYIFDKQGQRVIATLRVAFRFSRDKSGEPRIGFPIDVVFHDLNTCWNQRVRQFGNNTILRLRTMYAHELLQFAEWLKRFVELVTTYVTYCLDGEAQAQSQAPPAPPVPQSAQSQPTAPTPPTVPQAKTSTGETDELDELANL